jgi:hypothetical protein
MASEKLTEKRETQNVYPRSYQMDKTTARILSALCTSTGVIVIIPNILRLVGLTNPSTIAVCTIPIGILAVSAAVSVFPRWSTRVVLYDDAIEVGGWLSTRKLRRDEICGRFGIVGKRGGYRYVIVPFERKKGDLVLPMHMRLDKHFFRWMKAIPQIDRRTGH